MIPATRAAALLLAVLTAAACQEPLGTGFGGSTRSRASASDLAVCRKRADEIYAQQNRGAVYEADNYATTDRDSPFGSTGISGNTSRGLGAAYQRDQFVDACLNSNSSVAPAPGQAAPQPAVGPPVATPATKGRTGTGATQ